MHEDTEQVEEHVNMVGHGVAVLDQALQCQLALLPVAARVLRLLCCLLLRCLRLLPLRC